MKLELKHLALYLPYGLKLFYTHTKKIGQISNIYTIGEGYDNDDIKISIDYSEGEHIWMYKPILRPLSHYKKWIIKDIKKDLECTHNQVMEFLCFMDGSISLDMATVGLYNIMCKKHIDFNGLIDKELAININTLEK